MIEFPFSEVEIHRNKPLTVASEKTNSDVTQISPQKLTLRLRPGKSLSSDVGFKCLYTEAYQTDWSYKKNNLYGIKIKTLC